MPTQEQIHGIVETVQHRLEDAAQHGAVRLQVTEHDLDDEWLYIVVTPAVEGVRASDHAELMARIERELRAEGIENVLLVPTLME